MSLNKNSFPVGPVDLLIFQSTSFCNLDCSYCYLPDRLNKSKMDIKTIETTIKKIVSENLAENKFSIVWHAGEPMVMSLDFYKQVYEIIKSEVPDSVKVTQHIQTNATLINDDWCRFFKDSGMKVGVSLDGPEHINDRNRVYRNGRGSFEKVLKGINYLKKHDIEFSVISVLTDYSLDYADEIYNFFYDLGNVRSLGFNMDEEDGVNTKSTLNDSISPKLKNFWKRIFRLQLNPERYLHIREIFAFNELLLKGNFSHNNLSWTQMTQPLKIITVDTNGSFSTFSPELIGMKDERFKDFNFGNINSDKFDSIRQNQKFNRVFDEIINGIKKCKSECEYYSFCGGGAPSNKLYENGSFDTTETNYCKFSKKILVDSFMEEIKLNLND